MIRKITFILAALISVTTYSQNAIEINEQSKTFIQSQEFDKAVPLLKQAADSGVAEAQYNLGVTLEYGYGIEKNIDSAFYWYLKSADQGWSDGLYKMMIAHANGIGSRTGLFRKWGAYLGGTGTVTADQVLLARRGFPNAIDTLKQGTIFSTGRRILALAGLTRDGYIRGIEVAANFAPTAGKLAFLNSSTPRTNVRVDAREGGNRACTLFSFFSIRIFTITRGDILFLGGFCVLFL